MGLDQLLELTSNVAAKALPIVGVIVLIFLVIFVRHLIVLLKSANEAVISMKKNTRYDKQRIGNTGKAFTDFK